MDRSSKQTETKFADQKKMSVSSVSSNMPAKVRRQSITGAQNTQALKMGLEATRFVQKRGDIESSSDGGFESETDTQGPRQQLSVEQIKAKEKTAKAPPAFSTVRSGHITEVPDISSISKNMVRRASLWLSKAKSANEAKVVHYPYYIDGNITSACLGEIRIQKITDFFLKMKRGPFRRDFVFENVLGIGSMSKCYLAKIRAESNKKQAVCVAIKVYKKKKMLDFDADDGDTITNDQINHLLKKEMLLRELKHPFVSNLICAFSNTKHIFHVFEFCSGGELFHSLSMFGSYGSDVVSHFMATIVLALGYLLDHDIVLRDLIPENILLNAKGYPVISNFNLCRQLRFKEKCFTMCGTPEYMAPEMIQGFGYTHMVDWWSLGVTAYELLSGYSPFYGESFLEVFQKVVNGKLLFSSSIPLDAQNFCRDLIKPNYKSRMGSGRYNKNKDVKNHPYLAHINWNKILAMEGDYKYLSQTDPCDTANFEMQYPNTIDDCDSINIFEEVNFGILSVDEGIEPLNIKHNMDVRNQLVCEPTNNLFKVKQGIGANTYEEALNEKIDGDLSEIHMEVRKLKYELYGKTEEDEMYDEGLRMIKDRKKKEELDLIAAKAVGLKKKLDMDKKRNGVLMFFEDREVRAKQDSLVIQQPDTPLLLAPGEKEEKEKRKSKKKQEKEEKRKSRGEKKNKDSSRKTVEYIEYPVVNETLINSMNDIPIPQKDFIVEEETINANNGCLAFPQCFG